LQIGFSIAGTFDSSYSGGNVLAAEEGASCKNLVPIGECQNNDKHGYSIFDKHLDMKLLQKK
jgi:hypothetical protein